ncbi:MAG TPA: hypothetical protein VGL72_18205 [Bryobacteraceae bacterium]|jgi:hypothetical protein
MNIHRDGDSVGPQPQRKPYHTPRLANLGSVQSLAQLFFLPGSDGGLFTDCAQPS